MQPPAVRLVGGAPSAARRVERPVHPRPKQYIGSRTLQCCRQVVLLVVRRRRRRQLLHREPPRAGRAGGLQRTAARLPGVSLRLRLLLGSLQLQEAAVDAKVLATVLL